MALVRILLIWLGLTISQSQSATIDYWEKTDTTTPKIQVVPKCPVGAQPLTDDSGQALRCLPHRTDICQRALTARQKEPADICCHYNRIDYYCCVGVKSNDCQDYSNVTVVIFKEQQEPFQAIPVTNAPPAGPDQAQAQVGQQFQNIGGFPFGQQAFPQAPPGQHLPPAPPAPGIIPLGMPGQPMPPGPFPAFAGGLPQFPGQFQGAPGFPQNGQGNTPPFLPMEQQLPGFVAVPQPPGSPPVFAPVPQQFGQFSQIAHEVDGTEQLPRLDIKIPEVVSDLDGQTRQDVPEAPVSIQQTGTHHTGSASGKRAHSGRSHRKQQSTGDRRMLRDDPAIDDDVASNEIIQGPYSDYPILADGPTGEPLPPAPLAPGIPDALEGGPEPIQDAENVPVPVPGPVQVSVPVPPTVPPAPAVPVQVSVPVPPTVPPAPAVPVPAVVTGLPNIPAPTEGPSSAEIPAIPAVANDPNVQGPRSDWSGGEATSETIAPSQSEVTSIPPQETQSPSAAASNQDNSGQPVPVNSPSPILDTKVPDTISSATSTMNPVSPRSKVFKEIHGFLFESPGLDGKSGTDNGSTGSPDHSSTVLPTTDPPIFQTPFPPPTENAPIFAPSFAPVPTPQATSAQPDSPVTTTDAPASPVQQQSVSSTETTVSTAAEANSPNQSQIETPGAGTVKMAWTQQPLESTLPIQQTASDFRQVPNSNRLPDSSPVAQWIPQQNSMQNTPDTFNQPQNSPPNFNRNQNSPQIFSQPGNIPSNFNQAQNFDQYRNPQPNFHRHPNLEPNTVPPQYLPSNPVQSQYFNPNSNFEREIFNPNPNQPPQNKENPTQILPQQIQPSGDTEPETSGQPSQIPNEIPFDRLHHASQNSEGKLEMRHHTNQTVEGKTMNHIPGQAQPQINQFPKRIPQIPFLPRPRPPRPFPFLHDDAGEHAGSSGQLENMMGAAVINIGRANIQQMKPAVFLGFSRPMLEARRKRMKRG